MVAVIAFVQSGSAVDETAANAALVGKWIADLALAFISLTATAPRG
jgi:hypothetical protein